MVQGLWFGSPSQAVTDVREREWESDWEGERKRKRALSFWYVLLHYTEPPHPTLLYDLPLWRTGKYSNVNVPVLALIFKTKGYRVRLTVTLHKLETGHFIWHVMIYQYAFSLYEHVFECLISSVCMWKLDSAPKTYFFFIVILFYNKIFVAKFGQNINNLYTNVLTNVILSFCFK